MKKGKRLLTVVTSGFLALCMTIAPLAAGFTNVTAFADSTLGDVGLEKVPDPIDPQSWKLSRALTWEDWKPNPLIDWVHDDEKPVNRRVLKGALVLVDFPDRKFLVSEPNADLMQNPLVDKPVDYADLADFWKDYLTVPGELNNGVTIGSYWRENTYGVQDVALDAFGPYTLSRFEFQYSSLGITNDQRFRGIFPAGTGMATEAYNLAKASGDVVFFNGNDPAYDFVFFIHAGYDPSGLWQETGEMMFQTRQDIPYEYSGLARLDSIEDKITEPGFDLLKEYPGFYMFTKPTAAAEKTNYYNSYKEVYFKDLYEAAKIITPGLTEADFEKDTFQPAYDAKFADDVQFKAMVPDILKGHIIRAQRDAKNPLIGTATINGLLHENENMKWANTRYVPYASWFASMNFWTTEGTVTDAEKSYTWSVSTQGESDGMGTFAHEFGHIRGLPDNYNSPYALSMVRSYTGPWDLMSRGSGNGPGGYHQRYQAPANMGGSAPPNQVLYGKLRNHFTSENDIVDITVDDLKTGGPVIAEIVPRNIPTNNSVIDYGVNGNRGLRLTGFVDATPRDNNTLDPTWPTLANANDNALTNASEPRATIDPTKWNWGTYKNSQGGGKPLVHETYTIEVVDKTGYDSFCFDSGVLLAKTVRVEDPVTSGATVQMSPAEQNYHANTWIIDAHPGPLGIPDFIRPNGEVASMTDGDQHQLAAALFHAGVHNNPDYGDTFTGNEMYGPYFDKHPYKTLSEPIVTKVAGNVVNEWVDEYNNLHFYILDKIVNPAANGEYLSYEVGVLHKDGKPVGGELVVEKGELQPATAGRVAVQEFKITNKGADATDIIRVEIGGTLGYKTTILNNLFAIAPDETITVPVYIEVPEAVGFAAASVPTVTLTSLSDEDLTLTASSESNAAKTSTATVGNAANQSTVNKLIVTTDKAIVSTNEYFNVNVKFAEKVSSNTAILTYTFDTDKFEYRGLGLAPGVKALNTVVNGGTLKITVMVDDYDTLDYGNVLFSANGNIDLTNKANEILVKVECVVKDANGEKTIQGADGGTVQLTGLQGDTNGDGKVDLIDLSNMIDWYGFNTNTPDWETKYVFYDFNRTGEIDISDVTKVAQLINL